MLFTGYGLHTAQGRFWFCFGFILQHCRPRRACSSSETAEGPAFHTSEPAACPNKHGETSSQKLESLPASFLQLLVQLVDPGLHVYDVAVQTVQLLFEIDVVCPLAVEIRQQSSDLHEKLVDGEAR